MKTQAILKNPIAKRMYDLKLKTSLAVLNGRCKEARVNQKEFAKLAIDNFSTAIDLPAPVTGSFPWYSDFGLNTIKFMIYKAFCKKTPEEKKLKAMVDDYRTGLIFDLHQ